MATKVVKKKTIQEEELYEKIEELALLENELTIKELELVTLQAELRSFQIRYNRIVGTRYAELDKISSEIAEILHKQTPENEELKKQAEEAKQKYKETEKTIKDESIKENEKEIFKPSEKLKKLYREIAKKVHPDFAIDDKDREIRTKIMAEVNEAYKNGDQDKLLEILKEWETNPELLKGSSVSFDLERAKRRIKLIKIRIDKIFKEIAQLRISELNQLKVKTDHAEKNGVDLLIGMSKQIQDQIDQAFSRLSELKNG
jgi:hypothetical protein